MTLVDDALAWAHAHHPHGPHLERAHYWVCVLDPDAGEALQLAAALHDIERAFPDLELPFDSADAWDDPAYLRYHQHRSATFARSWLEECRAEPALVDHVVSLVRVHEEGGSAEADVLQAADSLSFLETLAGLTAEWVASGRTTPARARGKLVHMLDRIRPEPARQLGRPLLDTAMDELEGTRSRA